MYIPLVTDLFAVIMKFIMTVLTNNFALAIIIFTVVTKLLLFPLQLKTKKSIFDQRRIAPKMQKLQKKYGNNQQKYSQELQKLYKEENVSMFGGCLPTLLLLPILLGLYGVVYKPLTYLMDCKGHIAEIAEILGMEYSNKVTELEIARNMVGRIAELKDAGFTKVFEMDFNFLWMNLSEMPSFSPMNLLAILPIASGVTAFLSSWLSQKQNPMPPKPDGTPNTTGKSMLYIMPLMSVWIGFMLPAGLTLYWIVNNILSAAQEPLLNAIAKKRYGNFTVEPEEPEKKPKPKPKPKPIIIEVDEDDEDYADYVFEDEDEDKDDEN